VDIRIRIISLLVITALLLTSVMAQGKPHQKAAPKAQAQTNAAAAGSNTPGRIAKFTDSKFVGDSNITEGDGGKIGIGTALPTSQLTVNGVIEVMGAEGGVKFPDGTLQMTAGLATVSHDSTLKGNGTQASPLGLADFLNIGGTIPFGIKFFVANSGESGTAIAATGGPDGGVAVHAMGADNFSPQNFAGVGIRAVGGRNDIGAGGDGVQIFGGQGALSGGFGLRVEGGLGANGNGGDGVRARGGVGRNAGNRGGHAIEAIAGPGANGATPGLAGKFTGDVQVTGILSKAGGSFKIDHPLDPENKYLYHSFVESPDMMNIYNGNVVTDESGEAIITLPDYFEALNKEFRYQLTVVGTFAQAMVAEEVKENRFTIRTSAPGVKVSWQVTGIRQDAWANKNRIKVEENKTEKERGFFLHPEAFGKAEERGVDWANQPELMREMKQGRLEPKRALQQPK
jgi:hypothetical protein